MKSLYEKVGAIRRGCLWWFFLRTRTVDWTIWRIAYERGYRPARYPVPAVVVRTGFMPSGVGAMRGVPYIWLTSGTDRCSTFWKGIGLIEEWYDRDGKHHLRRYVRHHKE